MDAIIFEMRRMHDFLVGLVLQVLSFGSYFQWGNYNRVLVKCEGKVPHLLLDDIFEVFKDGNWHTVAELVEKFHVDPIVAEECVHLLVRSGFLRFDESGKRAIIESMVQSGFRDELEGTTS